VTPAPNFLARLARRALAPPEVRPRLASRFEAPLPVAAEWTMAEAASEHAPPVTGSPAAVPPPLQAEPRVRSDSHGEVSARRDQPPRPVIQALPSLVDPVWTKPPAALSESAQAPAPKASAPGMPPPPRLAVAPVVEPLARPQAARETLPLPAVESPPPATVRVRHETLLQLVAAPTAAVAPATSDARASTPPPMLATTAMPPQPTPVGTVPAPIEITIGRIEISAIDGDAERRQPHAAPTRGPPALSLADYLRRREGRGS
jgi:translation initiation factor IF-2